MIIKTCDLWLERADYRCILTSGALVDGPAAVLDTPSAQAAAKQFNGLAEDLGRLIAARGNHVHLLRDGLLAFPTRQFQWSAPMIPVITRSAKELMALVGPAKTLLPRPAGGPGEPKWDDVATALAVLPDNIIIVTTP